MANRKTAKREVQKWKKKLRSWGMAEDELALCIKQIERRQREKNRGEIGKEEPLCTRAEYLRLAKNHTGDREAAIFKLGDDYEEPDDKGYHPSRHDPLLHGPARVTGIAAKVVQRSKTITKSQYDALEMGRD